MKKAIAIIAVVVLAILIAGSKPKAVRYEYDRCQSLWDLAERHCPESVDKRDFIEEVRKINGIEGSVVYAGREYQYPVYEHMRRRASS